MESDLEPESLCLGGGGSSSSAAPTAPAVTARSANAGAASPSTQQEKEQPTASLHRPQKIKRRKRHNSKPRSMRSGALHDLPSSLKAPPPHHHPLRSTPHHVHYKVPAAAKAAESNRPNQQQQQRRVSPLLPLGGVLKLQRGGLAFGVVGLHAC